jgi:pimeloyl-ACP methyl ester carboxylesterase
MERTVEADDGRKLQVAEYGDRNGFPVLVHMGTPSSRLVFGPHVAVAEACGVRLLSYDRPGYGGSTPRPGRTVADSADDVQAVAEAYGIEQLGVWGFSGGPPHSLAAAALLPGLVTGAVVLASPAPGHKVESGLRYEDEREELLHRTADDWRAQLPAAYAEFADFAVATLRTALAPGTEGWREDDTATRSAWGFDVECIRVPVRLRHGRADKSVPVENGKWLAARIPGIDAEISDDDHLGVFFSDPAGDFRWLASM